MTKPLIFVLQVIGAVLLILGIVPPVDAFKIILGAALLVIGGYGIRKRMKKTS